MNRITEKDLRIRIDYLNKLTGNNSAHYSKVEGETVYHANIGNYHLYFAHGSVGVHQMANLGGGVKEIIGLGTKRETYGKLCSLISGIELGKRL